MSIAEFNEQLCATLEIWVGKSVRGHPGDEHKTLNIKEYYLKAGILPRPSHLLFIQAIFPDVHTEDAAWRDVIARLDQNRHTLLVDYIFCGVV